MRQKITPTTKNLVLRNNVFYYRKGNKRISLKTSDLFMAIKKKQELETNIYKRDFEVCKIPFSLYYKDSSYKVVVPSPDSKTFIKTFFSLQSILTPEELISYIPNIDEISAYINSKRQSCIIGLALSIFTLTEMFNQIAVLQKPKQILVITAIKFYVLQKYHISPEEYSNLKLYDHDFKKDLSTYIDETSHLHNIKTTKIPKIIIEEFDVILYKNTCKEQNVAIPEANISQESLIDIQNIILNTIASTNLNIKDIQKPKRSILYILEKMFDNKGIKCEKHKSRIRSHLLLELQQIGLDLNSDFLDFNTEQNVSIISNHISNLNITDTTKVDHIGSIKRFIEYANLLDPDCYKKNTLALISNIKKTITQKRKGYLPFTTEHISKLFELTDVNKQFYTKHPEIFITLLVAIFSGSRGAACATLTFGDIRNKDNLYYFHFISDRKEKRLKTISSQRDVPVASQILNFNILQMITYRKNKYQLSDTDFIFPQIKNLASGVDSFFKPFHLFLHKKLNIIDTEEGKYTFHSIRDMVSNKLKDLRFEDSIINSICGWSWQGTMKKTYSKHYIEELKPYVDKIIYSNLNLKSWHKIIKEAYINMPQSSSKP